MRKAILLFVLILTGITIQYSCKRNELGDIGFPRVRTLVVEMITDTGAVFKGEIMDIPADCEIIDHGFVWSDTKNASLAIEKVSLGRTNNTGIFRAFANKAMVEGKTFYFKSFVQTTKQLVFGNELEFVSMGSRAPVITSISPAFGSWNDTIIIRGKYFSTNPYEVSAYFNDFQSRALSLSDTLIKTTVPLELDTVKSKVSIKCYNVQYPGTKEFELRPSVMINSIEPDSGTWNSVVKIRGKNFNLVQNVLFNQTSATVKSRSDTLILVSIPNGLASEYSDVAVVRNKLQFKSPSKFKLSSGRIKSIFPLTGTVDTKVTLKINNVRTSIAKVFIDDTEIKIDSRTDTSLNITMPMLQKSGLKTLKIMDGSFQINYNSNFVYKIPEVTSISPSKAASGDTVLINGNNFEMFDSYTVKIGINCTIISKTNNTIKVIIPFQEKKQNPIEIYSGNYQFPCSINFVHGEPELRSVSIIKENGESYLVLKGNYLGLPYVVEIPEIDNSLIISSFSSSEIKCVLPGLLNGTYSIRLKYYNVFENIDLKNCININGPYSLSTTISNSEFQNYYIVKNNESSFYISTQNKDFLFNINTSELSEVSKFLPLNPIFADNSNSNDDNLIYLDRSDFNMKRTNLTNKITTILSDYATRYIPGDVIPKGISFNGKIYLLGFGPNYTNTYNYLYDYSNYSWKSVVQVPVYLRFFNLLTYNNTLYIIDGYNFWKLQNNSIISLASLPESSNWPFYLFTIGTKAYFYSQVANNNYLYTYDFVSNEWSKLGSFPNNIWPSYTYSKNGKSYMVERNDTSIKIIEFDPTKL